MTAGRTTVADVLARAEPRVARLRRHAGRAPRARTPACRPSSSSTTPQRACGAPRRPAPPYNAGPDQRVTVKLAKPTTISRLQVSAFKNTTASRFAALKDFTFQVSDRRRALEDREDRRLRLPGSAADRAGPQLQDVHAGHARPRPAYVRFFVDSVQGETMTYAQAAELQVFGAGARASTPVAAGAGRTVHRLGHHRGRQPGGGRPDRSAARRSASRPTSSSRPARRRRPRRAPTAGSVHAAQRVR